MENLTHSLLGAVLAEAALPAEASRGQRTLFYVTGILAANLPDADLLYTSIAPPPLGYLLHHRGHTHTVVGLIGLGVLIGIVALLPGLRRLLSGAHARYWILVAAALTSHLIADSWNSYGVHPFFPFTNRWFYGDAVYILEPWLWTLLGVSVVMNTRSDRGRRMLAALLIGLPLTAAWLGVIGRMTVLPLAIGAATLVWVLRAQQPRARAAVALGLATAFVALSFGLRNVVRNRVLQAQRSTQVLDLTLNPRPANPLCWSALLLSRDSADSLVMQRGEVAIVGCGQRAPVVWTSRQAQSLSQLRNLKRDDCRVRAWLQFGRAPIVSENLISDARFGGTSRGNFSAMELSSPTSVSECPPHLTNWALPRADVL
jgi:inner membrane protein